MKVILFSLHEINCRLEHRTGKCLYLLLVRVHQPIEGRGGQDNEAGGKHDLAIKGRKSRCSRILIEPQDKEEGDVDFDVGLKSMNVFGSRVYETYKDSSVYDVDSEYSPNISGGVQSPNVYH